MLSELFLIINDIMYTDIILYITISAIIYLSMYYTVTVCYFILSHKKYKISNLLLMIILITASLIPKLNILLLLSMPFMVFLVVIIKIIFIIIIVFDVDIDNKPFCLILKIIINNIVNSSFRLI